MTDKIKTAAMDICDLEKEEVYRVGIVVFLRLNSISDEIFTPKLGSPDAREMKDLKTMGMELSYLEGLVVEANK